jgi:hypothetical protein
MKTHNATGNRTVRSHESGKMIKDLLIVLSPQTFATATSRTKANVKGLNESVLKKKKNKIFLFFNADFSVFYTSCQKVYY